MGLLDVDGVLRLAILQYRKSGNSVEGVGREGPRDWRDGGDSRSVRELTEGDGRRSFEDSGGLRSDSVKQGTLDADQRSAGAVRSQQFNILTTFR